MMQNIIMFSILAVIATVIVCFVVSTFLPGIERKYVHARIQQRIGPPVTSPGIMAPIKFAFKKNVDGNNRNTRYPACLSCSASYDEA